MTLLLWTSPLCLLRLPASYMWPPVRMSRNDTPWELESHPCLLFLCSIFRVLCLPFPTFIATIYRPTKHNEDCLNDFSHLLKHLSSLAQNAFFLGDFNIYMDNEINTLSKDFSSCLDSFGLQQYKYFPIHCENVILDLVYSGIIPTDCKPN